MDIGLSFVQPTILCMISLRLSVGFLIDVFFLDWVFSHSLRLVQPPFLWRYPSWIWLDFLSFFALSNLDPLLPSSSTGFFFRIPCLHFDFAMSQEVTDIRGYASPPPLLALFP